MTALRLSDVAKHFNIKTPLDCQTLKGGIANAPLYIYSEDKPLGVFKKVFQDLEFATKKQELLNKMRKEGPLSIPKMDLCKISDVWYCCMEYLPPDPSPQKPSIDCMLDMMHTFHQTAKVEEPEKLSNFWPIVLPLCSSEINPAIIQLAETFSSPEFIARYNALPKRMIHGDFHCNNIVTSEGRPYIIDFDNMHYGARLLDISSCILFDFFDPFYEMLKDGSAIPFLKSHFDLEPTEIDSLTEIFLYREVQLISWLLSDKQDQTKLLHYHCQLVEKLLSL